MNWTSLKRTVAPGGVVVTLTEAKAHLRMTHVDDDTLITGLIEAATSWVEKECNRALAEQTWAMTLGCFPRCGWIRLPVAQVVSVVVTYRDAAGDTQTLDAAKYIVVSDEFGAELCLAPDQFWPTTADRPDAVTITIVAGYPKDGSDYGANVPGALKVAIKLRVELDYGQFPAADVAAKETAIANLIAGFKVLQR